MCSAYGHVIVLYETNLCGSIVILVSAYDMRQMTTPHFLFFIYVSLCIIIFIICVSFYTILSICMYVILLPLINLLCQQSLLYLSTNTCIGILQVSDYIFYTAIIMLLYILRLSSKTTVHCNNKTVNYSTAEFRKKYGTP